MRPGTAEDLGFKLDSPAPATLRGLRDRLFAPVDGSGLAYFRIAFGAIMLWEVWRFIDHDWVDRYYTGKEFYFKYWPFEFVQPWPGDWMTVHFYAMGVLAVFIIAGLWYRVSATLFFLAITYVFLLEQARYLNHLYLVCLVAFLMPFVPAHRYLSIDALRRPDLRSRVVPAWSIWLLRFQVGVPMFFGGIAKLNADWLRGEPLRDWLAARADFPIVGRLFTNEGVVWLMSYGGLFIDLLFVFFMLNRRTRVFAFIAALTFHFINARLFGIGIFPWFMIAGSVVFFEPDWPRRVLQDVRQGHPYRVYTLLGGAIVGFIIGGWLPETFSFVRAFIGAFGVTVAAYHLDEPFVRRDVQAAADSEAQGVASRRVQAAPARWGPWTLPTQRQAVVAGLALWVVVQVAVPLRHFVIPGNVHWTEEGHNLLVAYEAARQGLGRVLRRHRPGKRGRVRHRPGRLPDKQAGTEDDIAAGDDRAVRQLRGERNAQRGSRRRGGAGPHPGVTQRQGASDPHRP